MIIVLRIKTEASMIRRTRRKNLRIIATTRSPLLKKSYRRCRRYWWSRSSKRLRINTRCNRCRCSCRMASISCASSMRNCRTQSLSCRRQVMPIPSSTRNTTRLRRRTTRWPLRLKMWMLKLRLMSRSGWKRKMRLRPFKKNMTD